MRYIFKKMLLISIFATASVTQAAIIFEDSFESGDFTHAEGGVSWDGSNSSSEDNVKISTIKAHSGSHSIRFTHGGNPNLDDDAWAEQRFDLGSNMDEIYLRFYIYYPENYKIRTTPSSENTKLMYLWGDSYKDDMNKIGVEYETSMHFGFKGKVAGYPRTLSCSGTTGYVSGMSRSDTSISSLKGRWAAIEIHTRRDTGSGDGIFQMWIDGNLEIDAQNLVWAGAPCGVANFFRHGYLMGWSNSGFTETTDVYIDDVVFSTTYIGLTSDVSTPPIASSTKADVDANSNINHTDAMLTLRNSLGLSMSGTNWKDSTTTGDVNCDEVSNSIDAMLILRDSLDLDMSGTEWCVTSD